MSKSDQKFSDRPLTTEVPLKSQTIPCGFLLCTKFKRDGLFSEDFGLLLPASFHLCFIYIRTPNTDTMHTYVDSTVKDALKNYYWRRMTSAVHAAAMRAETNGRLPPENTKGTGSFVTQRRENYMRDRRPLHNKDSLFVFLYKIILLSNT